MNGPFDTHTRINCCRISPDNVIKDNRYIFPGTWRVYINTTTLFGGIINYSIIYYDCF